MEYTCEKTSECDVKDGSVDYYDFEWGDSVVYPESEMETRVYNCDSACNGTDTTGCGDNEPEQTDESEYDIIDVG